ncbi:MAG: type II and III secretion system protein family protein [Acidobacteriota bacterium]|nr:type II and III secretion system protein family protein [Acidobacteriota bacterium]
MTRRARAFRLGTTLALAFLAFAGSAIGQASQEIVIAVGNSTVIPGGGTLTRIAIGDPNVAEATTAGPTEVLVNGVGPGSTTLFIWTAAGTRTSYTIRVTLDAPSLEREFAALFPTENIRVTAVGSSVILSGNIQDPRVEDKVVQLAATIGEDVTVMNNLSVPNPGQVLLQVRFAEVSRSWQRELGPTLLAHQGNNVDVVLGPQDNVQTRDTDNPNESIAEVFSEAVNFFLFHEPSGVTAFIQALETNGLFKSLAEPNLIAMPAETASFLAGGEFPFPVLQGNQGNNAVTIEFKEFGIRLDFVPLITNSGSIRLRVSPEVSALDFANGLSLQGFQIPSLLARRASTVVELEDGQTFAIAGLVDNSIVENISQVPLLGDIPILGELFKSRDLRQNRSELLVLVTPRIVQPLDQEPPLPTGEPETWGWDSSISGAADEGTTSGTTGSTSGSGSGSPSGMK